MSKPAFTLTWHRTYSDYPHDYSGFDQDILVGRSTGSTVAASRASGFGL